MTTPRSVVGRDPAGRGLCVEIAGGRIAGVGGAGQGAYLAPGLVDLQVNGYDGIDLNSGALMPDAVVALVGRMLDLGVTRFLPTLTTASEADLVAALRAIAAARRSSVLARHVIPFVHVEGPAISPLDGPRGAHPLAHVRPPDMAEFERWQAASDGLEVVFGGLEDIGVGPETDRGARLLGRLALLEGLRDGVVVALRPFVAVSLDVHLEPGRQGVHHRDAHAVQPSGHRVGVGVELAAGVQLGHDDVDGGDPRGVHGDGDAAAVVGDLDAAVLAQHHGDGSGVARHGLVHGVVDHLPHQVVQAALARGPDVHARAFADGLEAFEDGDLGGVVFAWDLLLRGSHGRNGLLKGVLCERSGHRRRRTTSVYRF